MDISAAFSGAWRRMARRLFQPFRFRTWLWLGLCAWLAHFGEQQGGCTYTGGGGPSSPSETTTEDSESCPAPSRHGPSSPDIAPVQASVLTAARCLRNPGTAALRLETAWQDIRIQPEAIIRRLGMASTTLLALACAAVAILILLAVAIGLTLSWVKARFEFIFLDSVLHDREEIAAGWQRYRQQGNALFWWRLVFGIASTLALLLLLAAIIGGALCLAWESIEAQAWLDGATQAVILAVAGTLLLLVPLAILLGVVGLFLRHFIVQIMYRYGLGVNAAWGVLWPRLAGNKANFALFTLLAWALAFAAGIAQVALMLGTCCLCCLGLIPVVGGFLVTVATLPIPVFMRLFSAEILAQVDPQLSVLPTEA
jgi:hypothetical protein